MVLGMENMLYMITGETEKSSKLYFYIPGGNELKGKLNPTNPVVERQRTDTPALIQEAL